MMDLKSFTDQVHKMRLAQERVDHLAESMTEFDSIRDAEIIAKNLEKQVDQSIQEINRVLSQPAPMPEDRPAIIVQPLTE